MINVKRGLELYKIIGKLMKNYSGEVSVNGIYHYLEKHCISVSNIETNDDGFDIDVGIISLTLDTNLKPYPSFLIQVEDDFNVLGGWARYNTKTGYISFPYLSEIN